MDPVRATIILLMGLGLPACLPDKGDDSAGGDGGSVDGGSGDGGSGDGGHATECQVGDLIGSGCYWLEGADTTCPDPADVPVEKVGADVCGACVVSVDGPGELSSACASMGGRSASPGVCAYPITYQAPWPEDECVYGRPLVVDGNPRLAPPVAGDGWATALAALRDDTRALDPVLRRALVVRWTDIALAEHASVASFARFVLDLAAVGAPADLLDGALAAAQDEVRHARLAFGVVVALGGEATRPGPLPTGDLAAAADLVALARATLVEGAIAETLASAQLRAAADAAASPALAAVLRSIADDEARHAALAWKTLRWLVDLGGAPVAAAIAREAERGPGPVADGAGAPGWGVLGGAERRALNARCWAQIVLPLAASLSGAATPVA